MSKTRKNKKSIWIDKSLHSWYKQRALDDSKVLDRTVSIEEIVNEALNNYKLLKEDQKNEPIKQNRILQDSKTPG